LSGRAEVWKTGLYDDEPQMVDAMGVGDAFGDEALVTGGARSATVKMIEDGELLVLGEDAFHTLMSRPLIGEISTGNVPQMLQNGWKVIDVRYEEEFEDGHMAEAMLMPLPNLRQLATQMLDLESKYIAVCRSGKRSAVAAFLLKQRGYKVVSMQGGMTAWEGAA
jgi:rhodanese-related sulfurtransferase